MLSGHRGHQVVQECIQLANPGSRTLFPLGFPFVLLFVHALVIVRVENLSITQTGFHTEITFGFDTHGTIDGFQEYFQDGPDQGKVAHIFLELIPNKIFDCIPHQRFEALPFGSLVRSCMFDIVTGSNIQFVSGDDIYIFSFNLDVPIGSHDLNTCKSIDIHFS